MRKRARKQKRKKKKKEKKVIELKRNKEGNIFAAHYRKSEGIVRLRDQDTHGERGSEINASKYTLI